MTLLRYANIAYVIRHQKLLKHQVHTNLEGCVEVSFFLQMKYFNIQKYETKSSAFHYMRSSIERFSLSWRDFEVCGIVLVHRISYSIDTL